MINFYIVYALFVLFFILIVFIIFLMFRQNRDFKNQIVNFTNEQNSKNEILIKEFNDLTIDKFFMLNRNINEFLSASNLNTTNNLNNGMNSLNKKFQDILEKVKDIENDSKVRGDLKNEIARLNSIFSNVKQRGNFGEMELKRLLEITYAENKNFYELQKKLDNNCIVDCVLHLKNNLYLPIDSKFPLTNYQKICNSFDNKNELSKYQKLFINDIKRHIDDISSKYILPPKSTEYAIMFIPSEAIFTYICTNLDEIFDYMNTKSVFIASPSTLIALIHSITLFIRDERMMKNSGLIKQSISNLSKEFEIFKKQNQEILKYTNKLQNAIEILNKNSEKISKEFNNINDI